MIKITSNGNFKKTTTYMDRLLEIVHLGRFDKYGRRGVEALRLATPVDTGETANSWDYEIEHERDSVSITWTNSNVVDGVNIAVILHYGHGTRNGGYVKGRDYINQAIQPVFDEILKELTEEVKSL